MINKHQEVSTQSQSHTRREEGESGAPGAPGAEEDGGGEDEGGSGRGCGGAVEV